MSSNRRDFLKYFGIGATVAPVIAGIPSAENHAVIVSPPAVELAKTPDIITVPSMPDFGLSELVVFLKDKKTQQVTRIDAECFVMDYQMRPIRVAPSWSSYEEYLPGPMDVNIRVTGPVRMMTPRRAGNGC